MKLNQTIETRTNNTEKRSATLTPRNNYVELHLGAIEDILHGGIKPAQIDAENAISFGTALIEAGNVTRKAQDEDELKRQIAQARPSNMAEMMQELSKKPPHVLDAFRLMKASLEHWLANARTTEDELDAIEACIAVDASQRLLAQNQSGHARGTGIYVTKTAAAYEQGLYRNQGVFIAMQERRARRTNRPTINVGEGRIYSAGPVEYRKS